MKGGFVPDCHTLTFVEVAKLEFYMSLFPKRSGRRQTKWGGQKTLYGYDVWYADISPFIEDLEVIANAKILVDAFYPQNMKTFFGGHYYCFITREYLLNLLLYYYESKKCFPVGNICIVDNWVWRVDAYPTIEGSMISRFWKFLKRRDSFNPGHWMTIPALEDAKKIVSLTIVG